MYMRKLYSYYFSYFVTVLRIFVTSIDPYAGHSGRAVWGVGLGRSVAGIVGSNPA
jgi:hypothetical protein